MTLRKVRTFRLDVTVKAEGFWAVFGGRGITMGGMGIFIEQFNRTFKFDSVSPFYLHH